MSTSDNQRQAAVAGRIHSLNPEAYLAYTIERLARGHLASRLNELLPWNCKHALKATAA